MADAKTVLADSSEVAKTVAFTSGQVARLIGVSVRTATKWIDANRLKSYRIPLSQDRRVLGGDLLAFIKDNGLPAEFTAAVEAAIAAARSRTA